jgi:hypothetical protein
MPDCCPGVQDDVTTHGRGRGINELRTAYFAQAGEFAIRYGLAFELLIDQVRDAEACAPHTASLAIRYMDDLIHAAACVNDVDLAWSDLYERHERVLVRTCRDRLEPTDAIVFVRRFFAWLRRSRVDPGRPGTMTLRSFDGSSSMRRWLRERLLDALDRGDPWAETPSPPARTVNAAAYAAAGPVGAGAASLRLCGTR